MGFSVQDLYPKTFCPPRDYVVVLASRLGKDNVYKGESREEDLEDKTDDHIWRYLKDLIYNKHVDDAGAALRYLCENVEFYLR